MTAALFSIALGSAVIASVACCPYEPPPPDSRAEAVSAYLGTRPLAPYAGEMVAAADRYGIDWRIIPVISVLESSGGRNACGYNAWGVASCAIDYGSWEEGIDDVARRLSEAPYAGLTTRQQFSEWQSGQPCLTDSGIRYGDLAMQLAQEMNE